MPKRTAKSSRPNTHPDTPGDAHRVRDPPSLAAPLAVRKGVGPKRAAALAALGIHDGFDLLARLPIRHLALPPRLAIADLVADSSASRATLVVTVERYRSGRRRGSPSRLLVRDASGTLEALFFALRRVPEALRRGRGCLLVGRLAPPRDAAATGERAFVVEHWDEDVEGALAAPFVARYDLESVLPPRLHRRLLAQLLPLVASDAAVIPDWRTDCDAPRDELLTRGAALAAYHRPRDAAALETARRRLAYDELAARMAPLRARRLALASVEKAVRLTGIPETLDEVLAQLPISPTGAQRRAIHEIGSDLAAASPMHRLLHGEVGAGKTLVALVALFAAARCGGQGMLVAPTAILARQHATTAQRLAAPLGVPIVPLLAGDRAAERRAGLARLRSGEPCVAIGTLRLQQAAGSIPRLALVVIDEQQRFGVSQRARLRRDAGVDLLVMTATPIPRSLALVLYGDLDVSVLDEQPAGQREVTTTIRSAGERAAVLHEVVAAAVRGERVFVIAARIAGGDDAAAVEPLARGLATRARKQGLELAVAHGRRSAGQNAAALEAFHSGRAAILVATVVVEVGVDVAGARRIVIFDAERFGLAQLHQLRGRVGRDGAAASCVLVRGSDEPAAQARLERFAAAGSGFELAEADLELRGPGEIEGCAQHGRLDLMVARLPRDLDLLERALADLERAGRRGRSPQPPPILASPASPARGTPGPG
jgi:ATP-dependent DNA helicase RecG